MANPDELTRVGVEIVSEGTKLTGEVLLKILRAASKLFEDEKDKNKFVIDENSKEGKQKIKDLLKKHKEGVVSFEDNITKEQVADYTKEFKKMGVDFSITKNGKDSYSFFFASKDANVIEKALKNIVESKNLKLEEEREKHPERFTDIEPTNRIKNLNPKEAYEEAMIIQENYGLVANKVKWDNKEFLNQLKIVNPQEHSNFLHLKELNKKAIEMEKKEAPIYSKAGIKKIAAKIKGEEQKKEKVRNKEISR